MTAEQLSLVQRLRQLAEDEPGAPLYTQVAIDGTEQVLTSAELHRRSQQVAGEMLAKGVGAGDRVALAEKPPQRAGLVDGPHALVVRRIHATRAGQERGEE